MRETTSGRSGALRLVSRALGRSRSGGRNGRRKPVAFVLSSGANLGAVQVGMLRALTEHGIRPDMILGCSVGALNGAGFAQDPTLERIEELAHVWRTADGKAIMPRSWMSPARALARRGEAIHPIDGVRQLVEQTLTAPTFESLATPFQCVATDVLGACEHWFHSGPLTDAVLASAAMPAMFPSVEIEGRRYFDGAAVNDVPVRRAAELGARTLYVMEVGPLSRPWTEPRRPADTVVEAYWIARRHRFRRELDALPADVDVHVLPHGDPPSLRFHDFTRGEELMRNAYVESTIFLDQLAGHASSRPGGASRPLANGDGPTVRAAAGTTDPPDPPPLRAADR